MFARRRSSSSSLYKLPCLNFAFLTFCLVVVGHVSSMSLDRQRRQYQQQNDKQLELSNLTLPEAESAILQNDMQLVPAVEGNSDMYLLVSAIAANQEQNLQTELNDLQNSANVESDSDMLMQESEDDPAAVQTFKLTQDELKTQSHDDIVPNNELDQEFQTVNENNQQTFNYAGHVSVKTLNNTAEPAQEIQNELLGASEPSKRIEELIQAEQIKKAEKNTSTTELYVEDDEPENDAAGVQVNEAIKSEESEIPTEIENQYIDVSRNEMELQNTDEVPTKTLNTEKNLFDEFQSYLEPKSSYDEQIETQKIKEAQDDLRGQHIEDKYSNEQSKIVHQENESGAETSSIQADENVEKEIPSTFNEFVKPQAALHVFEVINKDDEQTVKKDEKHEVQEIKSAEQLQIMKEIAESGAETLSIENNEKDKKESPSDHEIPVSISDNKFQLSLESEVFNKTGNEKLTDNTQSTYEEQIAKKDEAQEEPPQKLEIQDDEVVQHIEDNNEKAEQSKKDPESGPEIASIEDSEAIQVTEIEQSLEAIQAVDELLFIENAKLEEMPPVKNSQTPEESQHDPKIQSVKEDIKSNEEEQSDEVNQTIEESKPLCENESTVDYQSIEDLQTVGKDETNEDAQTESSQTIGDVKVEYQNKAVVSDNGQITVENVKPVVMELQSLVEEHKEKNAQPLVPALETSYDELTPDESNDQEREEIAHQNIALGNDNIQQDIAKIENNQTDNVQDATVDIQKPLGDRDVDNILNNDNSESESVKEIPPILTTIVEVPLNEELTQHEQIEEQQAAVEETESFPSSKPLNVLDSVLNYVNASYTSIINHMNNDDNNQANIYQEVKEEDEQQLLNSKLRRYDGAQVWRIVVQNDRERKLADELQTKYGGQLWKEVKQEVDYLLKPQVLDVAEKYVRLANLTRIVLIDNLQKVIEVENPPADEIEKLQNRKGYRLTWQAYHRLDDIHAFFDYLAKTYPDICSVEIIGYSIEKRPLKILKISNGNANNTGIWIDGGMHAREWVSPAVVTYIANQIVEGWDNLPAYMRSINWYVHAVANPDGYEYSHTTDRLWRKNLRSHGRACPGVDLNRNFGYKWGGKGTSANPCSQTYRGSKAFSEPETFYISKFISNFPRETFKGYLTFHSYGQYILYPWGYDYHITPDMADLDLVARQAGTIITKSTGSKFTVGSSANTLYPAAGGSDDWAKGIAGIKYAYTIEMGDTGRYGFVLPAEYIEPNGKNGLTVVQILAKAITMGKNGRRRKLKAYKNI